MLTHIRHHSRWVLDPGRQDYTLNFIIQLTKFYTLGVVARGPAHLPIQSLDPFGTGCPSTLSRHSGQTKAPPDTVRQPKKERQAWNNTGSLSGHIELNRSTSCTAHPTAHLPYSHTISARDTSQQLIFTTAETHDNAHAPTTRIQHSIL